MTTTMDDAPTKKQQQPTPEASAAEEITAGCLRPPLPGILTGDFANANSESTRPAATPRDTVRPCLRWRLVLPSAPTAAGCRSPTHLSSQRPHCTHALSPRRTAQAHRRSATVLLPGGLLPYFVIVSVLEGDAEPE
jgi:hypothetical protein